MMCLYLCDVTCKLQHVYLERKLHLDLYLSHVMLSVWYTIVSEK